MPPELKRKKILLLATVIVGTLIWTIVSGFCFNHPSETSYPKASAALDRIKDWATWMTGLQTAVLASLGLILKDSGGRFSLTARLSMPAFRVLLFHGTSIILSTWILSSLPSIQLRLVDGPATSTKNDIYCQNIFGNIPVILGPFTGLAHFYCLCGFVCFAWFLYDRAFGTEPEI